VTRNGPGADVFFFVMTPDSIRGFEAEEGKGGAVQQDRDESEGAARFPAVAISTSTAAAATRLSHAASDP